MQYGLVLEGGGARGAYHVGAYKALVELGITIGGVTGTSIGALNGAAIVQNDPGGLEKLWESIGVDTLFGIDTEEIHKLKESSLFKLNIPYIYNLSKEILKNDGLDTSKMREIIGNFIDEDKIRKSRLDFGLVTISLTDNKSLELFKEDIPEGKLVDYLLASANLPVFKMEKLDGKHFLDGGFYDNLPIEMLVRKGYKDIIAVRVHSSGRIKKINTNGLNIKYIEPVESLGEVLDFDTANACKNIKLGYYDTIKTFNNLKGHKYYIKPYSKDFLKYMTEIFDNKQKIINISNIFGFEGLPSDRMLFEKIFPRLIKILEMKDNSDHQDILIRLVENVADKIGKIERFKIYDADEFIKIVVNQFRRSPIRSEKKIPLFMRQIKLLSLAVKDDLLLTIFREIFFE
jgi:NTE family protein